MTRAVIPAHGWGHATPGIVSRAGFGPMSRVGQTVLSQLPTQHLEHNERLHPIPPSVEGQAWAFESWKDRMLDTQEVETDGPAGAAELGGQGQGTHR